MGDILENNAPFYLRRGSTGCVLLHGFSAMPEEMRALGDYLADRGYSVLGARLAGHATHPDDLKHTRWNDWLLDVQDGLAMLSGHCNRRVLVGQSMGGMIALCAAASMEVSAVVALSTPYGVSRAERLMDQLQSLLHQTIRKRTRRFPPDHPLYQLRELDYPAYPEYPARIQPELDKLASAMVAALPQVRVPVLLVHSWDDHEVRFASMQSIYDHLGSQDKEMLPVAGMDHSLVMDPQRQVVFEAIVAFLKKLENNFKG